MTAFDEDNNGQNLWFVAKWIEESERQDAAGPSGGAGLGAFRIGLLAAAALFLPGAIRHAGRKGASAPRRAREQEPPRRRR